MNEVLADLKKRSRHAYENGNDDDEKVVDDYIDTLPTDLLLYYIVELDAKDGPSLDELMASGFEGHHHVLTGTYTTLERVYEEVPRFKDYPVHDNAGVIICAAHTSFSKCENFIALVVRKPARWVADCRDAMDIDQPLWSHASEYLNKLVKWSPLH